MTISFHSVTGKPYGGGIERMRAILSVTGRNFETSDEYLRRVNGAIAVAVSGTMAVLHQSALTEMDFSRLERRVLSMMSAEEQADETLSRKILDQFREQAQQLAESTSATPVMAANHIIQRMHMRHRAFVPPLPPTNDRGRIRLNLAVIIFALRQVYGPIRWYSASPSGTL